MFCLCRCASPKCNFIQTHFRELRWHADRPICTWQGIALSFTHRARLSWPTKTPANGPTSFWALQKVGSTQEVLASVLVNLYMYNYRRKFRSQTSDNMDRWKSRGGKSQREEKKRKYQRRERVRKKKIQMREKVGKSRNTVFFQWFVAPEGRKVGSLKRRVRSQLARWVMKNCTPLWREAHFEVKMYKTPQLRTTFGSCDVEKVHAVVAPSTCPTQNVQNIPCSVHFFLKLRCRKSARRCGAKHMSKSNCTKHTRSRTLLEVEMSKKCTPLWRQAHVQVKICTKHTIHGALFKSCDVEKVHVVVAARSTCRSRIVQNTPGPDHFWKLRCRKSARPCGAKQHVHVKSVKNWWVQSTFRLSDVWRGQRKGIAHLVKSEQNVTVL